MTGAGAADSVPSFADVLRLRSEAGAPEGVSRTTATLDGSWWSWFSPQAAFLAAMALTAARGVVADDRVVQCVNIHFVVPVGEEELALEARSLRAGGSSDVVRIDGGSGEVPVLSATVTLARHRPGGASYDAVPAPARRRAAAAERSPSPAHDHPHPARPLPSPAAGRLPIPCSVDLARRAFP